MGKRISKALAVNHVFGYTILNDVTARDLQKTHKQWYLGKAVDGFAPMGPWIVTSDELAADNLTITTTVNGEVRQNARTADLIFDIPTSFLRFRWAQNFFQETSSLQELPKESVLGLARLSS